MRVLIRPDWAGDFTMKRIRHTAEQIIRKLRIAEQLIAHGKTVAVVCRAIEVTQQTYHRYKQQYGGMQARGSQTADSAGKGKRSPQEASGRGRAGEGNALAAGPAKP